LYHFFFKECDLFEFIGAKKESINDGDVVIVDHDLENEETQITDTPGKYLVWKFHHLVEL
jgi:hypothetical protein